MACHRPLFVKNVLLEHSHSPLFPYCTAVTELSSVHRDHLAQKAKDTYLALCVCCLLKVVRGDFDF